LGTVSAPAFRPNPETFDKVYRGEPTFEGGPAPTGFLGPTTYLGNAIGFRTGDDAFPKAMAEQMPPEALAQMQEVTARFKRIVDPLEDDQVSLPFTVVHAHRVD
jgi:hypothetical protein